MRSTGNSYHEDHPYDNVVDEAGANIEHHHQPHQPQPPQQHAPQHWNYDPAQYHYVPPQQQLQQQQIQHQPLVDHHLINHLPPPQHHAPQQQQQQQHAHQHPPPMNHQHQHQHQHPPHPHHTQQHQHQQQQQQQQYQQYPHQQQYATMRPPLVVDPVWPSPAVANVTTTTNDAYPLHHHHHVDHTADQYHLHHTAAVAPLDELLLPPSLPPPPPLHDATAAVAHRDATTTTTHTRRSPKPKKTKTTTTTTTTTAAARTKPRGAKQQAAGEYAGNNNNTNNNGGGGGGTGGDVTYVLRIHEMLEDAEKESQTHIVSWQPHGRAFRIHNETLFVTDIMPRYFKAKLGSFRRWCRAWGFVRMTEGKDRGAWCHRHFVRGVTSFCKGMTRQQMAQSMVNWPPAGQVPDFYSAASASILSEQTPGPHHPPGSAAAAGAGAATLNQQQLPLAKNPRRLRGTILEDLRKMLEDAELEGQTHIVGWMPHGRAFKIHDKELFQGIMSRYFRTAKITHLSDTLRIWGFRRLKKKGRDKGSYYHKLFVRGDPSRSRHLPREQMKATMDDWPPPDGEPDLYQLLPATTIHQHPATSHAMQLVAGATAMATDGTQASVEAAAGHSTNHDPAFPALPPVHGYHPEDQELPTTNKEEATGNNRGDGTYVLRLYEMLEDSEKEGHQHIVSWQPHGRAFRIHKEEEFVQQIMPRYFKAQMKSFLRWCRAWGFVRMTEGKDRGSWYHRHFVRGVTSYSRSMSRQQMFKAMQDWLPPGYVPNFYASGSGSILSETNQQPVEPAPNVTCKNVKRLRGTVPEDLRQMLEEAEDEGNVQIVAWLSHGRAFIVYDKAAFSDHILPRYFKASKYTYFSDALRMWGWQRIKDGRDKGAYYHRLFVKGQPQLTRHLTRVQMKNSMTPWPPAEGEPNLYAPQEIQQQLQEAPGATITAVAIGAAMGPLPATEMPPPDISVTDDVANTGPVAQSDDVSFEDLDLIKHSTAQWQTAIV